MEQRVSDSAISEYCNYWKDEMRKEDVILDLRDARAALADSEASRIAMTNQSEKIMQHAAMGSVAWDVAVAIRNAGGREELWTFRERLAKAEERDLYEARCAALVSAADRLIENSDGFPSGDLDSAIRNLRRVVDEPFWDLFRKRLNELTAKEGLYVDAIKKCVDLENEVYKLTAERDAALAKVKRLRKALTPMVKQYDPTYCGNWFKKLAVEALATPAPETNVEILERVLSEPDPVLDEQALEEAEKEAFEDIGVYIGTVPPLTGNPAPRETE